MKFAIRPERPGDEAAIHALIARAFATQKHADGDEQNLVDRLRDQGDLALSLVATGGDHAIIGHIGFSPVTVNGEDCGWQQMAPVSVEPVFHRQGIGSALIREGIAQLRAGGTKGVGVVGDPAYYERFGFARIAGLAPAGPEKEFFRALVLAEPAPSGMLRYARAFG